MKEKIHPEYKECKVTCGCGNTFLTRSTKAVVHVEICSTCHPFYTGKQKFIDTAGRVEKFTKRHAWDDSTKDKVLEKEPVKKSPRKLEKVQVGLPPIRKRKALPGEEEEAGANKTEGGARGKGGGKGAASTPNPKGAKPAAAAPEAKAGS